MEENLTIYYGKYVLLGIFLSLASLTVLTGDLLMVSGLLFFAPPVTAYYLRSQRMKGMEENFRVFLDDLRDLLQAGVSISDALELSAHNDYGPLSLYVKRLAAQVKIGTPFEKAMMNAFAPLGSSTVRRIVLVINQTLRAGGNFMKVFATSTEYVEKIERLSRERKTRTLSVISNSYMMFFVFVFIVIGIQVYFLPIIEESPALNVEALLGEGGPGAAQAQGGLKVDFSGHFLNLLVVQAVFAGPMIGKIAENNAVSGIKHSLVLLAVSMALYLGALSIFSPGTLG